MVLNGINNMEPTNQQLEEFIKESNAIEGEYDKQSYLDSIKAWNYLMKQNVLTIDVILKTHQLLMKSRKTIPNNQKGVFRTCPVYIGGREALEYKLVPSCILMQFCFETMRANPKPDWKKLHILYEKIHPFTDGNGRTGRMFMNWTRIKRCGLPILIIHQGKEQMEYYKWFREIQDI